MRFVFLFLGMVMLAGCSMSSKPYSPPIDQVLQDPPPGQAIVYLLRAPYDEIDIEIYLASKKVAKLREGTYTAISLASGAHEISTKRISAFGVESEVTPPLQIVIKSGERRFFNVSGATARTLGIYGGVPIADTEVKANSRNWKEVTELDAQGLMSISRLVLPERGAL